MITSISKDVLTAVNTISTDLMRLANDRHGSLNQAWACKTASEGYRLLTLLLATVEQLESSETALVERVQDLEKLKKSPVGRVVTKL